MVCDARAPKVCACNVWIWKVYFLLLTVTNSFLLNDSITWWEKSKQWKPNIYEIFLGQWWNAANMLDFTKILCKCSIFCSSECSTPFLRTHHCNLMLCSGLVTPPNLCCHKSGCNSLSPHQLLFKVCINRNSPSWSKTSFSISFSSMNSRRNELDINGKKMKKKTISAL